MTTVPIASSEQVERAFDASPPRRRAASITIGLLGTDERRASTECVAAWRRQCDLAGVELLLLPGRLEGRPGADALPTAGQSDTRSTMQAELRRECLARARGDVVVFRRDTRPPRSGEVEALRDRLAHRGAGPRERGLLSVVVPAHNAAPFLERSLAALRASDLAEDRFEIVFVDDASTDDGAAIAARYVDTIVRLDADRPFGPAYARNRGFEVASGDTIAFVDADVRVHPDALSAFQQSFEREPELDAILGSYDTDPPARSLVSQHRNLLHHFYHQRCSGDVLTFWAGCGAIRSAAFAKAGHYDEWHFVRPQVEDLELGFRLRAAGCRVVLRPQIRGTHLKRWKLAEVITTDLRDRMVPWMRVVNQRLAASRPGLLSLRAAERFNTVLTCGAAAALVGLALFPHPMWGMLAIACAVAVLVANRGQYAFFLRLRGAPFTIATVPLDLLYYLINGVATLGGLLLRETVGEPKPEPVSEALAEIGDDAWPPVRSRRSGPFDHLMSPGRMHPGGD